MKVHAMTPKEELHASLERMAHYATQLEICIATLPEHKAREMQQAIHELRRALRGFGIVYRDHGEDNVAQ